MGAKVHALLDLCSRVEKKMVSIPCIVDVVPVDVEVVMITHEAGKENLRRRESHFRMSW